MDKSLSSQSWQASIRIVEDFLKTGLKLDELLERGTRGLDSAISRRVQFLSYGVVRNLERLRALLQEVSRKLPRKRLQAVLLVVLYEWLEAADDRKPQVVHHGVEQAKQLLSKPEARFVNAVLRRIPELLESEPDPAESAPALSRMFSHPLWLVEHWLHLWGPDATRRCLQWNQGKPRLHVFCPVSTDTVPSAWEPTPWKGFHEVRQTDWPLIQAWLAEGKAYVQDPSTRLGVELLKDARVGAVLDLCAAPGGKSIQLLNRIQPSGGLLVSVDLPGSRFERMQSNLSRYPRPGITCLQIAEDVFRLTEDQLPQPLFDVVYLDVPCSNTGVLQRRPDVKWRLTEASIRGLAEIQEAMLGKASRFVKKEGALIYSTCSVEPEENREVVERFLENGNGAFNLEAGVLSLPWESGHDGAGVYLLRRIK